MTHIECRMSELWDNAKAWLRWNRPIDGKERLLVRQGPFWKPPSVLDVLKDLPFLRMAPRDTVEVILQRFALSSIAVGRLVGRSVRRLADHCFLHCRVSAVVVKAAPFFPSFIVACNLTAGKEGENTKKSAVLHCTIEGNPAKFAQQCTVPLCQSCKGCNAHF